MQQAINSRADLESLRGTPGFETAMQNIYGSMIGWTLVDNAWVETEDLSVLARFDFVKADFLAEIDGFDFPVPTPPEVPPLPEPETLPNLEPYQFFAMLELSGKRVTLDAYIDALPEPDQTVARAKLNHSKIFRRDNDLVLAAQAGMGLTSQELDALWLQAVDIV